MSKNTDDQQLPMFENINARGHSAGKMFEQFCKFVKVCNEGIRVQLQGRSYVAMDRPQYEELVKRPKTNSCAITIDLFNGKKFTRSYSKFVEESTDINIKTDPDTTEVKIRIMT